MPHVNGETSKALAFASANGRSPAVPPDGPDPSGLQKTTPGVTRTTFSQ